MYLPKIALGLNPMVRILKVFLLNRFWLTGNRSLLSSEQKWQEINEGTMVGS